jgi:Flp pilus assembly protein TadB
MSDALKLACVAAGLFLAGIAGIVVFSGLWFRIGLGAAIVVVVGGLLLFAWRKDRKDRELRAGLERI